MNGEMLSWHLHNRIILTVNSVMMEVPKQGWKRGPANLRVLCYCSLGPHSYKSS